MSNEHLADLAERVEQLYLQYVQVILKHEDMVKKVCKQENNGLEGVLMRHREMQSQHFKQMEKLKAAQKYFTPEQQAIWQRAVFNDKQLKKREEFLVVKLQNAADGCQNSLTYLQKEKERAEQMKSHLMAAIADEVKSSSPQPKDLTEIHLLLDLQWNILHEEKKFQGGIMEVHIEYVREWIHKLQQESCLMQLILEEREAQITWACKGQPNPMLKGEEERIRRHQQSLAGVVQELKHVSAKMHQRKHDLDCRYDKNADVLQKNRIDIVIRVEGPENT